MNRQDAKEVAKDAKKGESAPLSSSLRRSLRLCVSAVLPSSLFFRLYALCVLCGSIVPY
jgi:hypothetical protein